MDKPVLVIKQPENPLQQRQRIGEQIANDIKLLEKQGASKQSLGLHLMKWLIETRAELETLRRVYGLNDGNSSKIRHS